MNGVRRALPKSRVNLRVNWGWCEILRVLSAFKVIADTFYELLNPK